MGKSQFKTTLNSDDDNLEAAVERAVEQFGGKVPHVSREALREDFRLQHKYPDQFVAFVDRWYKRGPHARLKRTVLGSAATMQEINDLVEALPSAKQRQLKVEFFEDPEGPIPLG